MIPLSIFGGGGSKNGLPQNRVNRRWSRIGNCHIWVFLIPTWFDISRDNNCSKWKIPVFLSTYFQNQFRLKFFFSWVSGGLFFFGSRSRSSGRCLSGGMFMFWSGGGGLLCVVYSQSSRSSLFSGCNTSELSPQPFFYTPSHQNLAFCIFFWLR